jgi:hypothetical protein
VPLCIYCHEREANSEEHDVPASLGQFQGHNLLLGRLCVPCNTGGLSKLDGRVARRGPEGFFRLLLGVQGRAHHQKKSPFYGRDYGAGPMRILAPLPEANDPEYEVFWEVLPGTAAAPEMRELRQIVVRDAEGKTYPIVVEEWLKTSDSLELVLAERGLCESTLDRMIAAPEEQGWLERVCEKLRRPENAGPVVWNVPLHPPIRAACTLEFVQDALYWRGIAKIGFHYALKVFPEFSGDEPGFLGIKRFIQHGEGDWRPFVSETLDDPRFRLGTWRPSLNRAMHVIGADKRNRQLKVDIRFFWMPEYEPPTLTVKIGDHDHVISHRDRIGDQYVFFWPEPRRGEHDGFVDHINFPMF